MTKPLILTIDDDQNTLNVLSENLTAAGYDISTASTAADAYNQITISPPDVVILEINLPGGMGIDVLRRIRNNPATINSRVIILSSRSDETDKVIALELGADDYMTKPFSIRELVARVKGMLRTVGSSNDTTITNGPLFIDRNNYVANIDGKDLDLTLKEFELISLLAEHVGKVMTRDVLLDRIWGYEFYGETRTVDVHIRHLRVKLGEYGDMIETIRGVGYKMKALKTARGVTDDLDVEFSDE